MANPAKEPVSSRFKIFVDAYDLVNCEEAGGNNLWLIATIGNAKSKGKHYAHYKESTKNYYWKKIEVKEIEEVFPRDYK